MGSTAAGRVSFAFFGLSVLVAPLAMGCVEPLTQGLLELLLFSGLAAWALSGKVRLCPAHWSILPTLLGLVLLAALQRASPRAVFSPYLGSPFTASGPATGDFLRLWTAYASALWCVPQLVDDRRSLRRLLWLLVATGVVVSVAGVVQAGAGNRMIYGFRSLEPGWRPFGPIPHRNHAASFLMMAFFCACGLFFALSARLRREHESTERARITAQQTVLVCCAAILLAGIVVVRSRAVGTITFMLSLFWGLAAVLSVRSNSRRWAALAAFSVGLVVVTYAAYSAYGYLDAGLWHPLKKGYLRDSLHVRLSIYRGGWELARDFPRYGIGLGATQAALFPYLEPSIVKDSVVRYVHSDLLGMLMEAGISGLVLWILGTAVLFVQTARFLMASPSREVRAMAAGMTAAMMGFLAYAAVDFPLRSPASAFSFLILTAASGASVLAANARESVEMALPAARAPVLVRVLAGLAALTMAAWSLPVMAGGWRAMRAGGGGEAAEAWESALRLDPRPSYAYRAGMDWLRKAAADPRRKDESLRRAWRAAVAAAGWEPLHPWYRLLVERCMAASGGAQDEDAGPVVMPPTGA